MPDDLESLAYNSLSPAIFCGYKTKESKITPSTTLAVFATLDGRRRVEIKLSQSIPLTSIKDATRQNWSSAQRVTLNNWDAEIPADTREQRYIMTGNILQAVADTQLEDGSYPGQLISYTDEEGNVHDGILMPEKWNAGSLKNSGAPLTSKMADILNGEYVKSQDGKVSITSNGFQTGFFVSVPKTKAAGGVYFEDEQLLNLIHQGVFYPYRGQLRADVSRGNIEAVVNRLSKLGVKVDAEVNEEEEVLYRDGEDGAGAQDIEAVNERFNNRLDELVANPTQKDRVLHLGRV